jgi:hypothetical protein
MSDRIRLDEMTSDDLDQLYEQLERAQRVAMDVLDDGPLARVRELHQPMQRGALTICAHCSHWDEKRQRCFGVLTDYPCDTLHALDEPAPPCPDPIECGHEAALGQAEEAARRALAQRQEMAAERYAWQERGDRAEAAIARVRRLAARIRQGVPWTANADDIAAHILAALDAPVSGPAATQATEPTVSRVTSLYERWVKAGPPPIGASLPRWWDERLIELHDAILNPTKEQP